MAQPGNFVSVLEWLLFTLGESGQGAVSRKCVISLYNTIFLFDIAHTAE